MNHVAMTVLSLLILGMLAGAFLTLLTLGVLAGTDGDDEP